MIWTKRREKIFTAAERWAKKRRQMGWRKDQRLFKEKDVKENLGEERALIDELLCPLCQIKEHQRGSDRNCQSTSVFSIWSTELSADKCNFCIHYHRNARIVSLRNPYSKIIIWGKWTVSSPWEKHCTPSISLCSWAILNGSLHFCPPPPLPDFKSDRTNQREMNHFPILFKNK